MDHVLWAQRLEPNACRLKRLNGFDDKWQLHEGLSLLSSFPQTASFQMNQDTPDQTLTPDTLRNVDRLVVLSTRAKTALERLHGPTVEYLPVTVLDMKQKPLRPSYYILNPIGTLPLVDIARSDVTMDELVESDVSSLKQLVIFPEVLTSAPPLFRAKHVSTYVFVRKDVARALDAQGFTGNRWIAPHAIANGKSLGDLTELPPEATASV